MLAAVSPATEGSECLGIPDFWQQMAVLKTESSRLIFCSVCATQSCTPSLKLSARASSVYYQLEHHQFTSGQIHRVAEVLLPLCMSVQKHKHVSSVSMQMIVFRFKPLFYSNLCSDSSSVFNAILCSEASFTRLSHSCELRIAIAIQIVYIVTSDVTQALLSATLVAQTSELAQSRDMPG